MANENRTYDLKVEKVIPKSPAEVFRAIGEGRLFTNCSADHDSLKIDFRVGGGYSIAFLSHNMKNRGEFLEIVPNQKIVFTWCQDYDTNPTPDTTVSIELRDLGGKTALTLTHTGFADPENRDGHQGGWSGGLDDLSQEITQGRLRLSRRYSIPVEKLFELCKNPASRFDIKGDVLENIPNQKIVFSLKSSPEIGAAAHATQVTLTFEADDDKKLSWLELVHEGLENEPQQKAQRARWDSLLKQIR